MGMGRKKNLQYQPPCHPHMVGASVVVSSQTTSVRAANMLASFILVPVSILLQFEAYLMAFERHTYLGGGGAWPLPPICLSAWASTCSALSGCWGATCTFAASGFPANSRRPSGRTANDGRYLPLCANGTAKCGALPSLRLPAAVLMLGLVAAAVGGYYLTLQYPLPPDMLQDLRSTQMQDKLVIVRDTMRELPLFIFSHTMCGQWG